MKPITRVCVYQPTARQVARALIQSRAYLLDTSGDPNCFFTWKSGIKAPVYCNCRILFGHPGPRATIVRSIASSMLESFPTANYVIGLAEAGVVWASAVAAELGLPVAYVSKAQKEHGIKGLVVGMSSQEQDEVRAVIVDDLVASGTTLERAIDSLMEEKGIVPVGIQSIVNWDFQKTHARFERFGLIMATLVSYPEILNAAVEEGLLDPGAITELCNFYKCPAEYVWTSNSLASLCSKRMARVV
jgi:orotate phosphoribosyltransferase